MRDSGAPTATPPVLLIVYRRPEQTARVFETIAAARPTRLFVAADGPRSLAEADACARTRAVATRVGWPCDVRTDFADENLGCRRRVISALSWFFSEVDAGIVLEDDCVPAPDFFRFCRAMLQAYSDDLRIVEISGETYQRERRSRYSYSFSKYPLTWGWATWRRAWALFDEHMQSWPEFRGSPEFASLWDTPDEEMYWTNVFQQMHDGALTTWDYAWWYACMTHGLSVRPNANLVSNIGAGGDATHTGAAYHLTDRPLEMLEDPLRAPPWVVRDKRGDLDTFDLRFPGAVLKEQRTLKHHATRPWRWLARHVGLAPRRRR